MELGIKTVRHGISNTATVVGLTALQAVAGVINIAARIVAPKLKLDIFPHRLWAGSSWRNWRYAAWNNDGNGNLTVEWAGWTVDASWDTAAQRAAKQRIAAAGAGR